MKKTIYILVLLATTLFLSIAHSSSQLNNVKIINKSTNIGATNVAINGATVNTGSISVKGANMRNITLKHKSTNIGTTNTAIGRGAESNVGSISY